jgi:hypothetical protein
VSICANPKKSFNEVRNDRWMHHRLILDSCRWRPAAFFFYLTVARTSPLVATCCAFCLSGFFFSTSKQIAQWLEDISKVLGWQLGYVSSSQTHANM